MIRRVPIHIIAVDRTTPPCRMPDRNNGGNIIPSTSLPPECNTRIIHKIIVAAIASNCIPTISRNIALDSPMMRTLNIAKTTRIQDTAPAVDTLTAFNTTDANDPGSAFNKIKNAISKTTHMGIICRRYIITKNTYII